MSIQPAPRIGIFDSGIGGLSVLRAVRQRLPGATCTYIADSRHTPWGERPGTWVSARCQQLAGWLIDDGADLVLLACNTGTTQAIAGLRARWPGRQFVGVEPGIKPAVAASRNGRVAVLATSGTLGSARMRALVQAHGAGSCVLHLPCPGLAEAIERADTDPGSLQAQLGTAARAVQASGADTVVLGCTHYPLVADALQALLGASTRLIDTADAVAQRVASLLAPPPRPGPSTGMPGALHLHSTARPEALQHAARRWLDSTEPVRQLHLPGPPAS